MHVHAHTVGGWEVLRSQFPAHPLRARSLISLLEVDLAWKLHRVSDGERRRVQVVLGLMRPCEVRRRALCTMVALRTPTSLTMLASRVWTLLTTRL